MSKLFLLALILTVTPVVYAQTIPNAKVLIQICIIKR